MADVIPSGASQPRTERSTNLFVSSTPLFHSSDTDSEMSRENNEDWDLGSSGLCTSAKQYRKMDSGDANFHYTWEQTNTDVAITVRFEGLSDAQTRSFDVTFTSAEVNIGIPGGQSYVIPFFNAIQKDKSRVQLKKGSITLLVVKQKSGTWPSLEPSRESEVDVPDEWTEEESGDNSECKLTEKDVSNNDVEVGGATAAEGAEGVEKEEFTPEIMEKEEEPVYLLDHLKHDFFERGQILTVQVFTKSLDKDAVKIAFTKQGFVLKFHTGDAKFLQLHEGTTTETTFTWPVTTRHEIVPEKCAYKVKASTIEVTLTKFSPERWASLEAPMRKETADRSKSDSWMPINKSNVSTTATAKSSSPAASATAFSNDAASTSKSSNVMFDDMSSIDTNDQMFSSKVAFSADDSLQGEEAEGGSGSFLGDNMKVRSGSSQDWNKPTATVHPLNNQASETGIVVPPGFAGLVNFGNTCFMNCVLQVLANTREFRDYFLDGRFQYEINEDNPLGMKGQLAATFGHLLKCLWSCKKHCWEPRKLKDLISKKNPQFFGYAQHDAHEFLAFLLDGLHEDLNRIRKKPYTETIDSDGRPDEVVAAEAWAQYKQRNDSVVVDLFQGQYKSKLDCPRCGKVSITFDPFLYLSVPLPKKKKIIPVTFMWKESYKKPVRYQIQVSPDSTVDRLMDELSTKTKVRSCDMRVFEAYRGRIHKFFFTGASLANVDPKDVIIANEVLSEELAGEPVYEIPVMQRTLHPSEYPVRCAFCHKPCQEGSPLKRCTKCYKVGYCDHTCQRNHWNLHKSQCSTSPDPIGCPFILSVPQSRATYAYLVKHMEGFARFSVDIFQPPVKNLESGAKRSGSVPTSNLNSSLSQSCSSLNSLDSLSSASSTCTLTGDQSDPQIQEGGEECSEPSTSALNDPETVLPSSLHPVTSPPTPSGTDSLAFGDAPDNVRPCSIDSGFESISAKSPEKALPTSQVMGIQATDAEREMAMPTFYIKPVTMEGVGIKGADRLEDNGDQPIEIINRRFLSVDWRNSEKQPSYVLVQSKELEAEEMDNLNNMAASGSNKPTLYQCLELFTEPEILNPEEAWYCPSCKKHVEASKQMSIWRLPHTLIIQLKRFSFQNFLMRSKIKKHVDFPTRGLDLTKFCVGLKPDDPPPIYDLYGVANHHGLLIGGHYTSYARCSSDSVSGSDDVGWRLCDDSRVTPIANDKSVVTADAYLLFYRHRNCQAVIGTACQGACTSQDANLAKAVSNPGMDSSFFYDDERNGNIIPTRPPNSTSKLKESVNNKLFRDLNKGEASDRSNNENMNRQNISRGKEPSPPIFSSVPTINLEESPEKDSSDMGLEAAEEEEMEKGEKEPNLSPFISQPKESPSVTPFFEDKQRHVTNVNIGKKTREEEEMEKGDKEKDFFDCDTQKSRDCAFDNYDYDDEEDDDDDREERNLVIDTRPDLGYTDMEAVD